MKGDAGEDEELCTSPFRSAAAAAASSECNDDVDDDYKCIFFKVALSKHIRAYVNVVPYKIVVTKHN